MEHFEERLRDRTETHWYLYFENAESLLFIGPKEFPIFCALCALMSSGCTERTALLQRATEIVGPDCHDEVETIFEKYGDKDSRPMWAKRPDGSYELIFDGCHVG